mgnify:FL=1
MSIESRDRMIKKGRRRTWKEWARKIHLQLHVAAMSNRLVGNCEGNIAYERKETVKVETNPSNIFQESESLQKMRGLKWSKKVSSSIWNGSNKSSQKETLRHVFRSFFPSAF